MDSFLVDPASVGERSLVINGDEAHHCIAVLRHRVGDEIVAIDGRGTAYRSRISLITEDGIECDIAERHEGFGEPLREVVLVFALLKKSAKTDIIAEKSTELGVHALVPVVSARGERHSANVEHLRGIARAAAKQSMRSRVPGVAEPAPLLDAVRALLPGRLLIAHEQERSKLLTDAAGDAGRVIVVVGPEGGLTDDEIGQLRALGGETVSLGPRRLRGETAAIVSVALLTSTDPITPEDL